jgi:lysophospholipase L1-like esterase
VSVLLSIEYYFQRETKKTKIKPYDISLYTHNGKKITQYTNPLKLATAPYTIYKNLPNQRTQAFTINALGFRGGETQSIGGKKKERIIVVGGSCAFGTGVENNSETFHVMLEKNLNNKYEVINAGVAGFLSGQELTYVVTELVDYHPDIIIAFNGWNDLFFTWYHDVWFGRQRESNEMGFNCNVFLTRIEAQLVANYRSQVGIFSSFKRFFNALVDKSVIVSGLREKIAGFKQQSYPFGLPEQRGGATKQRDDDYFEKIVDTYTKNLKKMHDFCHSQGIQFLVVFQPEVGLKSNINPEERNFLSEWSCLFSNYENEFPNLYKLFIERSKKILAEKRVNFIDINTYPAFNNNDKTLFKDVVHPNKNGNEVIANIINEYVKDLD